ncbi:MAG: hypothetical protein PHS16_01885 [Candidatus Colwellbacteria bacterium]|jgi:hypothetical protein|nr:hypothetical protein [Candidatus Colwellbacteria bacterium]MCK9497682.1 hypothetical protein [Candidatus Colwellbacteria bacterium]MDD3752669.1 hypothetical protein [Candidatus Colwellbacteria bacterium]MDD4819028.1 hypothetical protein [Candidatus Colwellbacteria bacterium]
MATSSEQEKKDPRLEALNKLLSDLAYENLSVQVAGEVKLIKDDYIRIKKDNGSIKAFFRDKDNIFVAKIEIDKDGKKSTKELSLGDIKEGDKVKASLDLDSSGEWQVMSISIRN